MQYVKTDILLIRDMKAEDAQIITEEEIAQGWHQTIDKYLTRLEHQKQGLCISLIAEYKGNIAGYINIYTRSVEGPYGGRDLPEIVDFGVLEKYRCKGIGTALMDQAELIAGQYADMVYLGAAHVCQKGIYSGRQRSLVRKQRMPSVPAVL